jgi:hypothetical protein
MKLFVGTKRPARPVDLVNAGIKAGVSTGRFKISRQDVLELRRLERDKPEAALPFLLRVLGSR